VRCTGINVPSVTELAWARHSVLTGLGLILPQHAATFLMMLYHNCPMWQLCLHLGNQTTAAVSMLVCETELQLDQRAAL